ncbi:DUF748 domain-containing protein [Thalassomonas sp. M1454]|uniref:DUF748 domain-containing protein n=1 Tax=Thalassomonas sp. M1454 TaxID=2594477 RepID=UPI00117F85F1|nr:DUF748 domain-containing protein [Thalassomonas sp. M1454]TRX57372.1 DUF748 domain-containing protein [Thalassomonas sp. M1454]
MKHFAFAHKGKLISLTVFLLFIACLPLLVKSYIISNIEKQGFDDVSIENITLNLFAGSIEIEHVNLKHNGKEKLAIGLMRADYRWQGIFSGGIETELIELRDTNLAVIEDGDGNIEVVIPIAKNKGAQESPQTTPVIAFPKLDVDLIRFSNISVDIQLAKLKSKLNIEEFTLTRLSTWHDYPAELTVKAKFNQANIDINLQAQPLAQTPSINGKVAITNIELDDFINYLPEPLSQFSGLVNTELNIDGSRLSKQQVIFAIDGSMSLSQLQAQYLALGLSANTLEVTLDSDLDINGEEFSYNLNADTLLSEVKALDVKHNYPLFDFNTLELAKLKVDENINLSLESMLINELNALMLNSAKAKNNHLVHLKQLRLSNSQLNLNDKKLSIEQIVIDKLTSKINLDKDYNIVEISSLNNFIDMLDESGKASATEHVTPDNDINSQPFNFSLGQVEASKGSVIHVAQETAEHKFRRDIFIEQFKVSSVNPTQLNNESNFVLKAKVGEFTSIDINGGGKLFAPEPSIKASGNIDEVSLARISPFIESTLGYQFISGQLDHKFDLTIANNTIDMKNELLIRKIEIKETTEGQQQNTASDLMPLPMAISMLENSDRTIDLDVPIKGELTDSKVGLQSIIQKALSKAMQKGSLSFLKYSLQPYGAVVFAAEYLIDESNNVNFENMVFEVNSSELTSEQQAYADKLVELLKTREQINLSLCGFSNAEDKEQILLTPISASGDPNSPNTLITDEKVSDKELKQMLIELASYRAKAVKRYFISKDIKSKRLFLCKAKFETDDIAGVKITM